MHRIARKQALALAALACLAAPAAAYAQSEGDGIGEESEYYACGYFIDGGSVELYGGGGDAGDQQLGTVEGAVPNTEGAQSQAEQAAADAASADGGAMPEAASGTPEETTVCDPLNEAVPPPAGAMATPPYSHNSFDCDFTQSRPYLVNNASRVTASAQATCWFGTPQKATVSLRACVQKKVPAAGTGGVTTTYVNIHGGCTQYHTFGYPGNQAPIIYTPRVACDAGRSYRTYRTFATIIVTVGNGGSSYKNEKTSGIDLPCVT